MKIVAIIPARGGSKGVPRKNIKLLNDKPLIAYTIELAKKSKFIDEVYVSTEDIEISTVSLMHGAKIIKRPKKLASDTAKTMDVIKHASSEINADLFVLLQCDSPLRTVKTVDLAINNFLSIYDHFDSLVSIRKTDLKFGEIVNEYYFPENKGEICRQNLKVKYTECGVVYIFKKQMITKKNIYGNRIMPFVVKDQIEMLEIDTKDDLKIIESIIKNMGG